jgi:hypothetical protein
LLGRFIFRAPGSLDPGTDLFNVTVTPADVGRTFRATPATDPRFNEAAQALTNGADDFFDHGLKFDDGFWGLQSELESEVFHRQADARPDLIGFSLTALAFRFDRLSVIVEPGNTGRLVDYAGLLTFEGTANNAPVPEPGTLLLFASGAAAISRRAWKRRACNVETRVD